MAPKCRKACSSSLELLYIFFSPLEHNKKIASPRAPGGAKKKYMYLTELDLLGLVTSEHKWAKKELFLHTLNNFNYTHLIKA